MHDAATLARFAGVGAGAAALLFALTWLLSAAGLPAFAAGTLGYALSFAAAYLAQRGWSFAGRHTHRHALPRYLASQAIAALVAGAVAHAAAGLGATDGLASAASTIAASGVSLLLSLAWVFPARPAEGS
jgi:putative flippase GtrA